MTSYATVLLQGPITSLATWIYSLLQTNGVMGVYLDPVATTATDLYKATQMFGLRSSISLFQDVARYNDAGELARCAKSSLTSPGCVAINYELVGTTLFFAYFFAATNNADIYVDTVIEPWMLGIFYALYALLVLPSLFHDGFLFALMNILKPAQSIFMLYLPPMLENYLGFTNYNIPGATIPYFAMELIFTFIPHTLFLGTSAFAASV